MKISPWKVILVTSFSVTQYFICSPLRTFILHMFSQLKICYDIEYHCCEIWNKILGGIQTSSGWFLENFSFILQPYWHFSPHIQNIKIYRHVYNFPLYQFHVSSYSFSLVIIKSKIFYVGVISPIPLKSILM